MVGTKGKSEMIVYIYFIISISLMIVFCAIEVLRSIIHVYMMFLISKHVVKETFMKRR